MWLVAYSGADGFEAAEERYHALAERLSLRPTRLISSRLRPWTWSMSCCSRMSIQNPTGVNRLGAVFTPDRIGVMLVLARRRMSGEEEVRT